MSIKATLERIEFDNSESHFGYLVHFCQILNTTESEKI